MNSEETTLTLAEPSYVQWRETALWAAPVLLQPGEYSLFGEFRICGAANQPRWLHGHGLEPAVGNGRDEG